MPRHQNYAKSPICVKHDIVNCWDCDKSMKQKNINAHYKYEKMKNDSAHVGKEPHYYKPNQRAFSFNILKPVVAANTEARAENSKEQISNPEEKLEKPPEHEVQVKEEKLKGPIKNPQKQVEKPEIQVEKPENQVKIKSEDREEEQPQIQGEKSTARKRRRQPSLFSYQSQLIQFKHEVKNVIDRVTNSETQNYLEEVQKSEIFRSIGRIRR